eukprot:scaffold23865_cov18-Tisochrysis_lutea.AAC.1
MDTAVGGVKKRWGLDLWRVISTNQNLWPSPSKNIVQEPACPFSLEFPLPCLALVLIQFKQTFLRRRSIDAMQADPSSKQTMQAALWRATAFDASMLEAPTSGLTPAQLAGSIAGVPRLAVTS